MQGPQPRRNHARAVGAAPIPTFRWIRGGAFDEVRSRSVYSAATAVVSPSSAATAAEGSVLDAWVP